MILRDRVHALIHVSTADMGGGGGGKLERRVKVDYRQLAKEKHPGQLNYNYFEKLVHFRVDMENFYLA